MRRDDIVPRGLRPVREFVIELWKHLGQLDRRIIGHPTGFTRLDELTSGFQPGDFIVIAGRPGMGKSAFSLNLALNFARQHLKVAFFSLEMSAMQLRQTAERPDRDGLPGLPSGLPVV